MFLFQFVRPAVQTSKLMVMNYLGALTRLQSVPKATVTSAATLTQEAIPSVYTRHQSSSNQLLWKPSITSTNPEVTVILRMLLLQQSILNPRPSIAKEFVALGRNRRKGKRANSGKRPCSHARRRAKRNQYGNPRR
jgi:hypothetical protein